MSDLLLRDLDASWLRALVPDRSKTKEKIAMDCRLALESLAVAIPALQAHESRCNVCEGDGQDIYEKAPFCAYCDGTGKNPARRALDTVIGDAT